uniref:Uncharacterized protein n=1 Tax=Arundo donax TaxID=35708 RepID=A0A0A9DJ17_ARUDO
MWRGCAQAAHSIFERLPLCGHRYRTVVITERVSVSRFQLVQGLHKRLNSAHLKCLTQSCIKQLVYKVNL